MCGLRVLAAAACLSSGAALLQLAEDRLGVKATGADYLRWSLCDVEMHQNLGGHGPDGGEAALIFYGVAEYNGRPVDLKVQNTTTFYTKSAEKNGKKGCIARFNVRAASEVTLKFSFLYGDDGTPLPGIPYDLGVLDLDVGTKSGCVEKVTALKGLKVWESGSGVACEEYPMKTECTAESLGSGSNNPAWIDSENAFDSVPVRDEHFVGLVQTAGDSEFYLTLAAVADKKKGGRNMFVAGCVNDTCPHSFPCADSAQCSIVDDPHVQCFDGAKVSLARTADVVTHDANLSSTMWLVRSESLLLQGKMEGKTLNGQYMTAVAASGPLLGDGTLVVGSQAGQVQWTVAPSETVLLRQDGHIVTAELSGCVKLTIVRKPLHVNMFVTMPPQKGQDGLCGNHNGLSADDSIELIESRRALMVTDAESLFSA